MIRHLFEEFIASLKEWELINYDKNIINLIYSNFDEISELGKWWGKRWKKITELILANINNEDLELPKISTSSLSASDISNQNKIWKLEVWHFRWFQDVQEFNFWDNLNVIYWRNWYWKSSFSEALEYWLTWNIKECHSRWFRNKLSWYIKNIHSEWKIFLNIVDNDWNKIEVNEEKFRYNFIEKNRIDFFVNSKNTSDSDLLSNLFWYWFFNDFCDQFPNDLSQLDLNKPDLKLEWQLEQLNLLLKESESKYIQLFKDLNSNLSKLLIDFNIDKDFDLNHFNTYIDNKIKKYQDEISSINEVQLNNDDIKEKITSKNNELNKLVNSKWYFWKYCIFIILISLLIFFLSNILIAWIITLIAFVIIFTFYYKLNNKIKVLDIDISELNNGISQFNITDLPILSDNIKKLEDLKKEALDFDKKNEYFKESQRKLDDFVVQNKSNLAKIDLAKKEYNVLIWYKNWYKKFKELLDKFKNELSQWVIKESIEEKTKDIFNFLSQYKDNKIIIEKLNLPKSNNDNIEIINEKWDKYLALQVLSEWNLRALAISILFAKVLEDNLSFIICDDINNALDWEFRKWLTDFFIENESFIKIQKIILTHSELFWKKLSNIKNNTWYVLAFKNNTIIANLQNANCIELAEISYNNLNLHTALYYCRYELEWLIQKFLDKFWKWLEVEKVKINWEWKINLFIKYMIAIKVCNLIMKKWENIKIFNIHKLLTDISTWDTYWILNKWWHNQDFKDDEHYEASDVIKSINLIKELWNLIYKK
jgi:hypothetical protein